MLALNSCYRSMIAMLVLANVMVVDESQVHETDNLGSTPVVLLLFPLKCEIIFLRNRLQPSRIPMASKNCAPFLSWNLITFNCSPLEKYKVIYVILNRGVTASLFLNCTSKNNLEMWGKVESDTRIRVRGGRSGGGGDDTGIPAYPKKTFAKIHKINRSVV